MVFVHSRKDTGKTARMLQMKAQQGGDTAHFDCREEEGWHFMQQEIDKSKNRHVWEHCCTHCFTPHAALSYLACMRSVCLSVSPFKWRSSSRHSAHAGSPLQDRCKPTRGAAACSASQPRLS